MNLMYLPTIISLIIKYGPYISTLSTVVKAITPVAQELIAAITPIVQKQIAGLKIDTNDPSSIVAGVKQVLDSLGHPPMAPNEEQALTDRMTELS
jgi:hypothetical protein